METWIQHYRQLPETSDRDAFLDRLIAHYSELLEVTDSGYLLLDAHYTILSVNCLACDLLMFQPRVGDPMPRPGDLFERDDAEDDHTCVIALALQDGRPRHQEMQLRRDGEPCWLKVTAIPVEFMNITQVLVVLQDISATKRLQADVVAKQAALDQVRTRDTLTGLYNRRFILEELAQLNALARRYGTPFSIALIDLDHFKSVNNTYGHEAADSVLALLGKLIQEELRDADLGARYGEEEFMVLLPETGISDAIHTINRLRQRFNETRIAGIDRPLTLSAGVLEWRNGQSLEQLVFKTNERLTMAKYAGRNQVCGDLEESL
ncbi:MAG: diguanylate cyclase [Saccharospirillum sp.]